MAGKELFGKVFYDLGFEENSEKEDITFLQFNYRREILNDNLIDIFIAIKS